jgi:hypothetical protein
MNVGLIRMRDACGASKTRQTAEEVNPQAEEGREAGELEVKAGPRNAF